MKKGKFDVCRSGTDTPTESGNRGKVTSGYPADLSPDTASVMHGRL